MMKRVTWFVSGAVAGIAGAGTRSARSRQAPRRRSAGAPWRAARSARVGEASARVAVRCVGRRPSCAPAATARADAWPTSSSRTTRAHRRRAGRRRQGHRAPPVDASGRAPSPANVVAMSDAATIAPTRRDAAAAAVDDARRRAAPCARRGPGAHRRRRARACTGATPRTSRAAPAWSASRRRPRRSQAVRARRRRARHAVRRPRLRAPAWPAERRRSTARVVITAHEDEPGPLGRCRCTAWRGSSRACSTSTSPAPSPSSGCTSRPTRAASRAARIGGNVANNSGGPHCLADGVTVGAHPRARGRAARRRGRRARRRGRRARRLRPARRVRRQRGDVRHRHQDLRAPDPERRRPCARCCSTSRPVEAGAQTVSAIIAAGMVPAALEMMDQLCTRAVEEYIHAGLPVDAAAILLVEVDGLPHARRGRRRRGSSTIAQRARRRHGARRRRTRPSGSCCGRGARRRSARSPGSSRTTTCTTPSCRGASCPRCSAQVYEIAARHELLVMNVFHAGDGNLHPLLVFDKREPGVMERVHAAGEEIVRVSVAAGGVLSGEHGIGLEKRDCMPLMFAPADLAAQACAARRRSTRPAWPTRPRCCPVAGLVRRRAPRAGRRVDLRRSEWRSTTFADEVGTDGPVTIAGAGHAWRCRSPGVRTRAPRPSGIDWIQADEMIVSLRRGRRRWPSSSAALAEVGQRVALPPGGHRRRRARGRAQRHPPARRRPGARRAAAGPLRVRRRRGRQGRRADGEERHRLRPLPPARRFAGHARLPRRGDPAHPTARRRRRSGSARRADDPWPLFAALYRPMSVLWDGSHRWVLLEGHPADVAEQAASRGLSPVDGPPPLPAGGAPPRPVGARRA